jgi:hypothetical protein
MRRQLLGAHTNHAGGIGGPNGPVGRLNGGSSALSGWELLAAEEGEAELYSLQMDMPIKGGGS